MFFLLISSRYVDFDQHSTGKVKDFNCVKQVLFHKKNYRLPLLQSISIETESSMSLQWFNYKHQIERVLWIIKFINSWKSVDNDAIDECHQTFKSTLFNARKHGKSYSINKFNPFFLSIVPHVDCNPKNMFSNEHRNQTTLRWMKKNTERVSSMYT